MRLTVLGLLLVIAMPSYSRYIGFRTCYQYHTLIQYAQENQVCYHQLKHKHQVSVRGNGRHCYLVKDDEVVDIVPKLFPIDIHNAHGELHELCEKLSDP